MSPRSYVFSDWFPRATTCFNYIPCCGMPGARWLQHRLKVRGTNGHICTLAQHFSRDRNWDHGRELRFVHTGSSAGSVRHANHCGELRVAPTCRACVYSEFQTEERLPMVDSSSRAAWTLFTDPAVPPALSIVEEGGRDSGLCKLTPLENPMPTTTVPVPTRVAREFSTAADSLITCE